MQTKIDTLWVQGDLTDEQRTELLALMKENVKPESETPEALVMCKLLKAELELIGERVTKLENGGVVPEPPVGVVIEPWEPWDGIYAEYTFNGDKQELYEDVYKKLTNTCHTEE